MKLDILLAGESVDALSLIVPRERRPACAAALVEKLRQKIPRQMFEVPVQAAIGNTRRRPRDRQGHAQGRDSPSATAATSRRKRKLLEKQKEGKKRMKQLGVVEVPQEAFLAVLELDSEQER